MEDEIAAARSVVVQGVTALPLCTDPYRALARIALEFGRDTSVESTLLRGSSKHED